MLGRAIIRLAHARVRRPPRALERKSDLAQGAVRPQVSDHLDSHRKAGGGCRQADRRLAREAEG
ncbi:MAG TPA: hypothetical protein VGW35_21495, partial [Methylomirabilota bacterium]|nr:hypothetical protein [Methylomirabilota bacterium]